VTSGIAMVAGTETIAGSTLTLDTALILAIDALGLSRSEAVAALTATPARILGLADRFGLLAPGYAADVVVLDADDTVEQVWAAGTIVG
jgi:N-acetylglucosamine-6-phosphate deacetylase